MSLGGALGGRGEALYEGVGAIGEVPCSRAECGGESCLRVFSEEREGIAAALLVPPTVCQYHLLSLPLLLRLPAERGREEHLCDRREL